MPTHEQAQHQMAHKRVIVTFLLAQSVNGHGKLCGHNIPYCQVSHLTFVCTNRSLGSKCIELYDGYDLPACKKVELYREKAELWFTKAPHLLVTHGKYPLVMVLLSSAVADAQVASKATIWALNGLCRVKKCRFQFPSLPQKCS